MWNAIIVDDEIKVRQGLARVVPWSSLGFTVATICEDGTEALRYVTTHPVDLVVTDIKMPRMNGVELIKRVRETDASPYFIVLSGYDDYEYLKQAIRYNVSNYLLKPFHAEELRSNLEMIAHRLEERESLNRLVDEGIDALRNTLMQRIVQRAVRIQEIINKERFLGITGIRDWSSYHVGIVGLVDPVTHMVIDAEHRETRSLLETLRRGIGKHAVLVFIDREEHAVILAESANSIERIAGVADAQIRSKTGKRTVVFGGVPVNEILEVATSYASAYEHLQTVFVPPDSPVYRSHTTTVGICSGIDAYTIRSEEIDALIVRGDADGLARLLRSVVAQHEEFTRVRRNVLTTVMYAVSSMQRLFAKGRSLFDVLNVAPQDILQTATPANLTVYCDTLCTRVSALVFQPSMYTGNAVVDAMIRYIRSLYHTGISLKEYAHDSGMSAAYLGQLFRETTGEKFTRYVQRIRIEHAARLLTDTSLRIKEISRSVGFSDPRYFLAVFQSEKGCTPREFRISGSNVDQT